MNNQTRTTQTDQPQRNQTSEGQKNADNKRRGKIFWTRIKYSLKGNFLHLWKGIFFMSFAFMSFAFMLAICLLIFNNVPSLHLIIKIIMAILSVAIYIFFMLVALRVLAIPCWRAGKIEKSLISTFRNGFDKDERPILLHRQPALGSSRKFKSYGHTFLSEHVPIGTWKAQKERLVNMLGGHIYSIKYGGKKRNDPKYIVVVSGIGGDLEERPAISDPLFEKGVMP